MGHAAVYDSEAGSQKRPTTAGSVTTITTDPTPASAAKPPQPAFTTSRGSAPRHPGFSRNVLDLSGLSPARGVRFPSAHRSQDADLDEGLTRLLPRGPQVRIPTCVSSPVDIDLSVVKEDDPCSRHLEPLSDQRVNVGVRLSYPEVAREEPLIDIFCPVSRSGHLAQGNRSVRRMATRAPASLSSRRTAAASSRIVAHAVESTSESRRVIKSSASWMPASWATTPQ